MCGWGCRRSVDACLSTSSSGRFRRELQIAAGVEGAALCLAVVERNADDGVTWLHSYVSDDRR